MAFFDNIKIIKDSLSKTATNINSNISTANTEQVNLIKINKEIKAINTEIDSACMQIGKKFLDYVIETKEMPGIDIGDILNILDPKMTRKNELEKEVVEIQKRLKNQMILQEKTKLENEFRVEKEKLDTARAMEIISEEEYNSKIFQYRSKLDNFETIKKIEQQFSMGIINLQEKEMKINELLESYKESDKVE